MGLAHNPKIVTDGLVFCLDAANPKSYPGSGTTWSDLSKNNSNITLINGPSYSSNNNGNLTFDGVDDYARREQNCNLTGSITLECAFKSVSSGGIHRTLLCTDTTYQRGVKLMNYKNTNRWGIWLGFGTSDYQAFYTDNINDSSIHLLTGSWDQNTGNIKLYKDGVLVSTISSGQTNSISLNNGYLTLGIDYHGLSGGTRFNGNIYNAKIYNRVLSDTEILQNFAATRGRYGI